MADTGNPVRNVHEHLRRASALLAARRFDDARRAVDAALAIDPASLSAQAMHERIAKADGGTITDRIGNSPAPPAEGVINTHQPPLQRFVPSGVDAQSWIGFEQRIQNRRFGALLAQIEQALVQRDGVTARVALEEARELRPDAQQLADLSRRVAQLPMRLPSASSSRLDMRALSGIALLTAGVALLTGTEWIRPQQPHSQTPPALAASTPAVAPPAIDTSSVALSTPDRVMPSEPGPVTATGVVQDAPEAVPTTGVRPAVSVERPAMGGPAVATFRPATPALADETPRVSQSDGAIPDDDAAAQSRRQNRPLVDVVNELPPRETTQAFAAVTPPPVPPATRPAVETTRPVLPAVAAIAPGTPMPVRTDETRVTQVLNQYAHAYGQLDATAARAVWPTVDERALARAFAGLESQALSFDACDVSVRGTTATASCRGTASYVGKVGSREQHTEPRQWTFQLRREGEDAWKIQKAEAHR
jgi:hypothetical protein